MECPAPWPARHPASYAAWDILDHPEHGSTMAARPYTARRALLADALQDVGPPARATPATDHRASALEWCEALRAQGVEGIVAKPGRSAYPFGRRTVWRKVRHADTADARVSGPPARAAAPRALALFLDGESRPRLSDRLAPALATRISAALADAPTTGERRTDDETYIGLDTGMVVEVLAGSCRHGTLTVVRIR
ncbi:ATP-dependent DNA ligase [Streptomyces sp. NPDC006270]|uniref:ATP-dependent DNA ligase n=1 Tax=Streptomyces sp. NPDC006270 TaxID=3364741 RepID=UPI00369C036C